MNVFNSTAGKSFIISFIIVLLGFVAAGYYVQKTTQAASTAIRTALETKQSEVIATAEALIKNQSDSEVDTYIHDCSIDRREAFDAALNNLGSLGQAELENTSLLFDACASYFADRKTAMYQKLVTEYADLVVLSDIYKHYNGYEFAVIDGADWAQLLTFEEQKTKLLQEQVPLQREIINLLMGGARPSDQIVRERMSRAQEISETAAVLTRQIEALSDRLFTS